MARKILLADDSVTAQNMGRKILADAGYEVITVNNGSAALKKIGETKPDLIVLDVYMPGYSGLEVCQRIKDVGETAKIPILLTVGKLEPFKPEEAKRVRADAFIVKPFEASELLSALSKLEDKVVPRADASKPGRFARATAALDEGRYDKMMAAEEDDTGWKHRISFPTKKKGKRVEEEIDTGEIYNPVNKDLRTVVEHKGAEHAPAKSSEAHAAGAHVNVGALASEGLPKDVTPEEIAALAAAAAQIKGKVAEEKTPAPVAEIPVTAPKESETPKAEVVEAAKPESKEETRPAESVPAQASTPATPTTFSEAEAAAKIDEKKEEPEPVSTQADAMSAMMGLETQVMAVFSPGSGNGSWQKGAAERAEEPVTMAAAADSAAAASRWTAVAVALAPEESSLSLEQEMQKAYAAFAAAEGGHAAAVSKETAAVTETSSAAVAGAESPIAQNDASLEVAPIPATPAPEVAQPLAAVSEIATEAISAAVKELEAAAAKYEAERKAAPVKPIADKSLKAEALESQAPVASEVATIDQKVEEKIVEKAEEKVEPKAEEKPEEKVEAKVEPSVEERPARLPEPPPQDLSLTVMFAVPPIRPEDLAPPVERNHAEENAAPVTETPASVSEKEGSEEKSSSEKVATEPVPVSSASTGGDEVAKRESETAAAWASWRRIRETGNTKPAAPRTTANEGDEIPQDRAAMAVAAGAESKPEEVVSNLDSDPEISSIVDSVLADMRPKIVEEIARKMGKKK